MFTPDLVALLCCPTDHAALEWRAEGLRCTRCGTHYALREGYVELMPRMAFEHTTRYVTDEGGQLLDYRKISPPLLSAQVKNKLLNRFLQFQKDDVALDLGCGNGKFAYWNRRQVAIMLAADIAPWFADEARAELPLLRADLRALPIRDGRVDKVFSIDVLEHLTRQDIARVLEQVHRVLKPRGLFFVFSNTRERQTLAPLMAPQQAVTRWLVRQGIIDTTRDEWRKADHVKAIRTYEELCAVFAHHGFAIRRIVFWNGLFQGWIENVVVKLAESYLSRRARGRTVVERQADARAKVRAAMTGSGGAKYLLPLEALSKLMQLDLMLFGHLRAGPYFLLVEKVER